MNLKLGQMFHFYEPQYPQQPHSLCRMGTLVPSLPHSTLNTVGCVRSSWRSIVVIGLKKMLIFADKWNREINSCIWQMASIDWTKMQRTHNRERTVPSINSVGKTGEPQSEEWTWTLPHTIYKNQLEMEWRLNVSPENVKLLRRKQL